ncbi:MAG TPA: fasciclin domain-containing protein [Rhizomicrobium sp.]
MQHVIIAAIATALALGAGAGAVTNVGPADSVATAPVSDVANPMVAGQAMLANDNILDNASRSPEHTKLAAALKAGGVADLLKSKGTFTVFAPTDAAFEALSPTARAALFDPAHRTRLARAMRYLIVPGRLDSQTLLKRIGESGGEAKLKTVEGGTITATLNGPTNIVLMDEKGDVADIAIYDIYQSNGVIQVIDRVIAPQDSGTAKQTLASAAMD